MIKLKRAALFSALQRVIGVVERRNTFPILAYVLLEVEGDLLSITATDLELELKGFAHLDEAQPSCKLTLPGRKLYDICRALPEEMEVEIFLEKQHVIIKSGTAKFSLMHLPVDDFPSVDDEMVEAEYSISQKNLQFLISRTQFSMAQQDVRYYLNGMLFDFTGDRLTAVATDGHRLAVAYQSLTYETQASLRVIMPRKGIQELSRLFDNNLDNITVQMQKHHIRFVSQEFILTSKLIDGQFPDYHRVIPRVGNKVVNCSRVDLKQILQRVSILSNEKYRGIRFELNHDTLTVSATNPEQEQAEEKIAVDYNGDEISLGFNVTYLIDIVSVLDADTLKIFISDANSGVLIEEAGNQESMYVVMPMRV